MPEPCPMFATERASGRCASATIGVSTWVVKSRPTASGRSGRVSRRSTLQSGSREASGLPFVARTVTPSLVPMYAEIVAVRPSSW